ncbi:MAG: stage II sporulation protein P [Candidatus Onthomonas sp.]
MKSGGAGRRRARLAALGAAAAALWLLGKTADLEALSGRFAELLSGRELAEMLLEQTFPGPAGEQSLEDLVLNQLPPAAEEETEPAEPQPEKAEQSAAPERTAQPEEEAIPTTGLLEAPEAEIWPAEEEQTEPAEETFSYPVSPDDLELTNSTSGLEVELGDYLERQIKLTLSKEGPQILIMHTHGTEAYTMADGDDYTPSDTARTTDENYNMIRVGEEMKAVFEEMGLSVIHDTSLYDYPSYTGSYARSLAGIQSYLEQYPTISVVLDVHRDALIGADGTAYKVTDTMEDGETVAQVMLVVGSNDGGLEHPHWEDNLTLAAHIQAAMLALHPGFPRPVNLRSQRFNQHMTYGSLLVEVGTSGNTLQEALAGARKFAQAAGKVYLECMEE